MAHCTFNRLKFDRIHHSVHSMKFIELIIESAPEMKVKGQSISGKRHGVVKRLRIKSANVL